MDGRGRRSGWEGEGEGVAVEPSSPIQCVPSDQVSGVRADALLFELGPSAAAQGRLSNLDFLRLIGWHSEHDWPDDCLGLSLTCFCFSHSCLA